MGRLFFLFAGLVIGGGAIFTAFANHVVKSNSGIELVPKKEIGLDDVYVDVRQFTVTDWANHPALAADILAAEKTHLLGDAGTQTLNQGVEAFIQGFRR